MTRVIVEKCILGKTQSEIWEAKQQKECSMKSSLNKIKAPVNYQNYFSNPNNSNGYKQRKEMGLTSTKNKTKSKCFNSTGRKALVKLNYFWGKERLARSGLLLLQKKSKHKSPAIQRSTLIQLEHSWLVNDTNKPEIRKESRFQSKRTSQKNCTLESSSKQLVESSQICHSLKCKLNN